MADQRNGLGTPGQPDLPLNATAAGRKVAIPRLQKPEASVRSGFGKEQAAGKDTKNRVSHACEPCRQRKTKCSGERPVCRHCEDFRISCYYGDGKRDRAKNEMLLLQSKVENYERFLEQITPLLEQITPQVDGSTQENIKRALRKVANPLSSGTGGETSINPNGSTDPFTRDEDVFAPLTDGKVKKVGKSTDVFAAPITRDLSKDGTESNLETASEKREGLAAAQLVRDANILTTEMVLEFPAYHMDDLDLAVVGDQIDPYSLPTKIIADELVRNYFETVQPMFPILLNELFMVQYESFYKYPFTPESSKRWLAILNAIFAIGTVYSNIINPDKDENERNHEQYFFRARILSLDGGALYEAADLQQVQVVGLMGIYLMSTGQNNRAWNITGLAIRYARTLGLHLRTDSTRISEAEKEMRARIWYAINSLDKLLAIMTGRLPAIQDKDCTAPMPKPMEDEAFFPENIVMETPIQASDVSEGGEISAAHGLHASFPSGTSDSTSYLTPSTPSTSVPPAITYFTEYARVSKITVEAMSSLHCPDTMKLSWFEVQQKIADLDESLNAWRVGLPPVLNFIKTHRDQTLIRQRMILAFQYYHTRIIMNRPCLFRRDGRGTNESRIFNHTAALACVESARETLKLLTLVQDPMEFYGIAPWWCLFHYLISAGSVIIVEIAMKTDHNPRHSSALLKDAKKFICWLQAIGQQNAAARRAYAILSKLLAAAAQKLKLHGENEISNSNTSSPMLGVEITQSGLVPGMTASHSINQAYDELPAPWITSMMFPTPQQMHEINVEDTLSRRASILSQQSVKGPQRTPVYTEEYFPQWDPLESVLGKRPYGNMPYAPPTSVTEGEYSSLGAPEIQSSLQQSEAQLDGVTRNVQVDGIDGVGGSAGTPDGSNEDPSPNTMPQSISNFPAGRGQMTYHKQIRDDIFRRHSQVGPSLQQQQQQALQHHDRSKKRRESPS